MQVLNPTPHPELGPSRNYLEFNRLLAKLPVAAHTCNADGLITFFNEQAVKLWGREPKLNDTVDRFCGSFKLFSVDGIQLRHDECWMALALRNNKSYNGFEIVVERPDGSRFMGLAYASPLHDDKGQVVGAVNIVIDITDRRRADLTRAHLAAIVNSSDDAIISKNLDGIIQSWNGAAQQLFGYTADQAVGRHISFLIPPDRIDEEEHILTQLRAGEQVYHFDTVRVRSNGQPIPISVTVSPIRDDAGRIVGASKIARDISDRKQAEEQIYSLLTQMKEADRRKDEFLATLGHELRSPLASLFSTLETMKRGNGANEFFHQARETMERQLHQMVRLVDDLLDVSRIARNKLELRKERVPLRSILQQAVEVSRSSAVAAQHEIIVNMPSETIYLYADPVRLTQVFTNLLNNACKYTDSGGLIEITTKLQSNDVLVTIKDSGIGIPPDKLSSIFEMFTQIHSGLERSRAGLGIGLTLVKRLVEMHGGSVIANSKGVGRGSEFTVSLPLVVETSEVHSQEIPSENEPSTRTLRILVVDDNVDSADSLATLLQISGNETALAHDGLAAVKMAEQFRPDVVLMDIGLPRLDGHEAARRIREQSWGKEVVLVALTGWGQEEDRRRSKEAGFDEHMVKPVDYETLMHFLASV
jgi:two-component system, chemotaxis family, CheB/CheR fusion protein